MAAIQHKDMVSPAVHETKGISTAAVGTTGHSNGAGSETYTKDFANGIQIGGGTLVTKAVLYSVFITPGTPITAATVSEQSFTVSGLTTADTIVLHNKGTTNVSDILTPQARVSAVNTLTILFVNVGGADGFPGAETFTFLALRS